MEIIIKYSSWLDQELKEYLETLDGVINVEVDSKNDIVDIIYNDKISLKVLLIEIDLFLELYNYPSVVEFEKKTTNSLKKYTITIKNLCCCQCLFSFIEELLVIKGIISAKTNYDYKNYVDVEIYIEYDDNIQIEKIKELEISFN